jgi:hypothetical protein
VNDYPIRLKPDDAPPAPDPQTAAIRHMADVRALLDEARHLAGLLTHWGDDPVSVFRRAQTRAVELSEQAARVQASGETLVQAMRAGSHFSAAYGADLGVR